MCDDPTIVLGFNVSPLLVDHVDKGGHILVDQETKDAHHDGVAVVEIDGTLGEHGLPVEVIPAKVDLAVVRVLHKVVADSFDIVPEVRLEDDSGREIIV